ncbi:LPS export ABC transporter permease LptG [Chitiniphilus shinanonensis]|uniref:LPS export ABC transporter permease LptG n=1 Tax=Chitiniphilus shinanonensis TaxID=553088 RepID=A0ABQ6BRX3_9NEIS|nr:LPS export ABC transporter permease LptG [Chitiniphilus shinanonensis]GLS04536.1 LPS export ABC transporter permease LptG [Chitiniphilus shinanonensis]
MSLLARYLFKELTIFVVFTLLGLLGLYTFFDFIAELSDLGDGGYRVVDAVIFVLLRTPGNAYELMPIAVLIGAIFALANLAGNSELTVMRASGVSVARLLGWLIVAGVTYAAATVALGEFIVPQAERMANQHRLSATKKMLVGEFRSGVWVKDDRQIVNIGEMLPDLTVLGVRIYELGEGMSLSRIVEGLEGHYIGNGRWSLSGPRETRFAKDLQGVQVVTPTKLEWKTSITPEMLAVLLVEPSQMSAQSLYRYIDHLKRNRQQTSRYELALWGKLFYPLACLSMMVIALPFAQSQRRSANVGTHLFVGILAGLVFHFLNRVVVYLGQLNAWPPPIVVSIPTLLFMAIALLLLWRQEKR